MQGAMRQPILLITTTFTYSSLACEYVNGARYVSHEGH